MTEPHRRSDALAAFIASTPIVSAGATVAVLAVVGTLVAILAVDGRTLTQQLHNPKVIVEWIGAGLTTIVALAAAFRIHARGRTLSWRVAPLGLFALWQIVSIYGCRNEALDRSADQILYGHSPECFLFILAASIPVAIFVFFVLRRYPAPISGSAAALTGLGTAAFAVWLMQFFHLSVMNLGDWAIHFAAIGVVVGSTAYAAQLLPTTRR